MRSTKSGVSDGCNYNVFTPCRVWGSIKQICVFCSSPSSPSSDCSWWSVSLRGQ